MGRESCKTASSTKKVKGIEMDSLKNSRILLTGGTGFVGSYIIDQLLQEPVREIVVIDNFVRGSRKNLERALQDKRVHLTEGDIRDRDGLDRLFEGIDYCFHLAALRITHSAAEPRHACTTGRLMCWRAA